MGSTDAPSWLDFLARMEHQIEVIDAKLDRALETAAAHAEQIRAVRIRQDDTEDNVRDLLKCRRDYGQCDIRHEAVQEMAQSIAVLRTRSEIEGEGKVGFYRSANFWIALLALLVAGTSSYFNYQSKAFAASAAQAPQEQHETSAPR